MDLEMTAYGLVLITVVFAVIFLVLDAEDDPE